jgi:hypothetical protein
MNREDIIRMARNEYGIYAFTANSIAEFINLIAAAEREACAAVCEELLSIESAGDKHMDGVTDCIAAIRARGQA